MHLTLVFLGEIEPARVDAMAAEISRPVEQPPFDLVFAGFGVFPPRGAPRALWIGARRGEAELRRLQETLAGRLERLGVARETRPFTPHLTLARWKSSRPSDRSRVLQSAHDRVVARVRIDHATLYHSRLSSGGSTYVELARATLSGRC